MNNQTIITLSEQEALLFIEFQKRHAFFKLLESVGAFNIRSGSIKINFDSLGCIGSVEKMEYFKPEKLSPRVQTEDSDL